MTRGQGRWPRDLRKLGRFSCALLLEKSVELRVCAHIFLQLFQCCEPYECIPNKWDSRFPMANGRCEPPPSKWWPHFIFRDGRKKCILKVIKVILVKFSMLATWVITLYVAGIINTIWEPGGRIENDTPNILIFLSTTFPHPFFVD